ncbi:MAG: hypothetical protein JWO88_2006 [Frankiales bacterium]|nr:hypothetical protein [Frankiales bacterium]
MTTADVHADLLHTGPVGTGPSRLGALLRRVSRPFSALRAVPHITTYLGMAVTLAGGVLLLVAWGRTAALTNVGLQMPYLISAGCTGVGLVAVGLTVVNLAAKAEDARRRRDQLGELQQILAELRRVVEEQP